MLNIVLHIILYPLNYTRYNQVLCQILSTHKPSHIPPVNINPVTDMPYQRYRRVDNLFKLLPRNNYIIMVGINRRRFTEVRYEGT